jgi:hypothetical protein
VPLESADLSTLAEHVRRHPEDHTARLKLADQLVALGQGAAARAVLAPFESAGHPLRAVATARLAALDENEGLLSAAVARWERLLADDIDHDEAWAHLSRLRRLHEDPAAPVSSAASPVAPLTLDSASGVDISRFRILREIGRGGSATVYLAVERDLAIELALKVLHPRAGGPAAADLDRRFFHEARTAAALRHPGVVAIYDVDEPARTLVMEYLAGGTLRDRLRATEPGRGLPLDEAEAVGRRLLETLDHVHGRGVVHGDITPRNVLLRRPGEPVLVDFGIARLRGRQPVTDERAAGTPLYLAPEQFRGAASSVTTDLFAVGALLWESLAGHPMRRHADLMANRLTGRALPPAVVGAPDGKHRLATLIEALTHPDPARRPASAQAAIGLLLG